MNEQSSFERIVAEQVGQAGIGTPPVRAIEDTISRASRTRPLPRWLALIKEPPMRTNSQLAVGSPTVRVAAVMVATLLLAASVAGAGIAGSRLLAANGPIVVDQADPEAMQTITRAVAEAQDGDTILVKPGTYAESVVIEKDITIRGDTDDPASVVIDIADDGPVADWSGPSIQYAFQLVDADADISNLTITGPGHQVSAFVVSGGEPAIHDLVVKLDDFDHFPHGFVYMDGGGGEIRDNLANTRVDIGGTAAPLITGNAIGNVISSGGQSRARIVDNELGGVWASGDAAPVIERNRIASPEYAVAWMLGSCAVEIEENAAAIVDGNVIRDSLTGVCLTEASGSSITGNMLLDNQTAISLRGSDATVSGNTVEGGTRGIMVAGTGVPTLTDNAIEGAASQGILITSDSGAVLSGNTICGNATNLVVQDGADARVDESNEICPDSQST